MDYTLILQIIILSCMGGMAFFLNRTYTSLTELHTATKNTVEILANEQDRQNNFITHVDNRISEVIKDMSNTQQRLDTVEFYQRELENEVVYKPVKKARKKAR